MERETKTSHAAAGRPRSVDLPGVVRLATGRRLRYSLQRPPRSDLGGSQAIARPILALLAAFFGGALWAPSALAADLIGCRQPLEAALAAAPSFLHICAPIAASNTLSLPFLGNSPHESQIQRARFFRRGHLPCAISGVESVFFSYSFFRALWAPASARNHAGRRRGPLVRAVPASPAQFVVRSAIHA